MAIDTSIPRTRRALLAGGLGGVAALVASAIGRPLPASAADGEIMVVGGEYTATSVTKITQTTALATAIMGTSTSAFGVVGTSTSNYGVLGESSSGTGVVGHARATSGATRGVYGRADSAMGTGVVGYSGTGASPAGKPKTGVYGYADDGFTSIGVYGESRDGDGVYGKSANGYGVIGSTSGAGTSGVYGEAFDNPFQAGVHGSTKAGYGVSGYATSGIAGWFRTEDPKAGYALQAVGRVKLDKCAGVAMIAATKSSVVVTPGIDLVSTSAVVATLQGSAGSATTTVSRCYVNTTTNTFTIYLTKAATQQVKVAWHVFG